MTAGGELAYYPVPVRARGYAVPSVQVRNQLIRAQRLRDDLLCLTAAVFLAVINLVPGDVLLDSLGSGLNVLAFALVFWVGPYLLHVLLVRPHTRRLESVIDERTLWQRVVDVQLRDRGHVLTCVAFLILCFVPYVAITIADDPGSIAPVVFGIAIVSFVVFAIVVRVLGRA